MAVFIAPAVANITRTFGVQPAELTQSQILYSDSIDYFLGGSLLLKNGQTDKYLFDGGYVRSNATTGNFSFFYYNKDHLGNNREVLDHRGAVRQVTSYYPFGAPYADDAAISGTGIQPYKYNGKELDLMHGLNTYDYGARQYYSILGRWDRVDPLCEKYYSTSPYVYCENDPVNAIDPDGRFGFKVLAKAAYKVGKTVAKNGLSSLTKSATYAAAFNDVVEDAKTVFDPNASTIDKVAAGLSIASEALPISASDIITIVKVSRGGNKMKALTKASTSSSPRFVVDSKGNTIDTHSTPSGSYKQPNGDRTDILQKKEHFNKKGNRNDGFSHTHPVEINTDENGVKHSKMSDNTHQPTYDEIKNIENGNAQKIR